MRIAIDARMLGWTGIGRVTSRLLELLPALDKENEYIVLLDGQNYATWQPPAPNFSKVRANYKPYGLAEQILLPLKLYGLKPDLVHFLSFNLPLAYFGRYVVTINDLTLLAHKTHRGNNPRRLVSEFKYWVMRFVLRHDVKASAGIITISNFVRDQLVNKYGKEVAKKTAVTYLAGDKLAATPEPMAITQPFILYVGNFYPNKNIGRLLAAFVRVRKARPELKLIITGKVDYFSNKLQQKARELGLDDAVVFTGFVSDGELAWLYSSAEAFVFPSLSEGFGLPALEAMSQGTPVISSNATSLPEVCGNAAAYFDPTDVADIANVIIETLNDPKRLAELKKAGASRVKQFSWRRMAEQTLAAYHAAMRS